MRNYVCCEIDREEYYFDAKKIRNDFLEEFKKDRELLYSYASLKSVFNSEEDNFFAIYNKEILTDDFIFNFMPGMNNRWDIQIKKGFDPAVCPAFSGFVYDEKEMKDIQDLLVFINNVYGKNGLDLARQFYIGQTIIMPTSCIILVDPEEKYDLPKASVSEKIINFNNSIFDLKDRIQDIFNSKILVELPNENIKSALVAMPYLLYDENGNFLDEEAIFCLVQELSRRLNYISECSLNLRDFQNCQELCDQIYLERNLHKYLKIIPGENLKLLIKK